MLCPKSETQSMTQLGQALYIMIRTCIYTVRLYYG